MRVACGAFGGAERYSCLKTTIPLKFSYDVPHLDQIHVDPAGAGGELLTVNPEP